MKYFFHIILTSLLYVASCFASYSNATEKLQVFDNELISNIRLDPKHIINEITSVLNILKPHDENIEDASLHITQLVLKYGYEIQSFNVETDDGYLLTMFRIPSNGPPVFLMHGLYCSADDWVIAGPESALAYILASAGYDVWIGNARGNKHSRKHLKLSPNEPQFWHFSWDEIGRYDLPAMIDQVLDTSKQSQLAYIGHSQGTTSFFVLCSELPEYNEKISTMIALSPVAWMAHVYSPLLRLIAPFSHASWIMELFDYDELLPKNKEIITSVCGLGNGIVCITALFAVCGFDYEQVNVTNTQSIFGHFPSGVSLNQVVHYLQNIVSKDFLRFDYGADKNQQIYKCSKPPRYPVEKITAPVNLMYSDNDWLSNIADVLTLKRKLKNVSLHRVPFKKFSHMDFLYAKDVKRLVYSKIMILLAGKLTVK